MAPTVITLRCTVSRADGEYELVCHDLDLTTTGTSLDDVLRAADDMIRGYFDMCRRLGKLDEAIARLVGSKPESKTIVLNKEIVYEEQLQISA